MPDPSTSPEAIAARNALQTARTDEERRTAALRLLAVMLGPNAPQTAPVNRTAAMPTGFSRLSPEAQSAWITMQDAHPQAVDRVAVTTPTSPWIGTSQDTLGEYRPMFRSVSLREEGGPRNWPITLPGLIETLAHELAHVVGAKDSNDPGTALDSEMRSNPKRAVTSYDVGQASRTLHEDINLPVPVQPAPTLATLMKMLQQKPLSQR